MTRKSNEMEKFICLAALLFAAIAIASAAPKLERQLPPSLMLQYNWPEPDFDINQFPHESSCHHYYLVLSEEDISVEKCPEDLDFDFFEHKCVDQDVARCWNHHFGKYARLIHHNIKKPFRCPFAWGKYPDVYNCTMYYVCLNGEPKHKKCASFEHFDKVQRKCVAEIEGVCADPSDVVEHGYKCPHPWGSFVFHKDCSKYYECLEKRPTLRSCPQDFLFSKKNGKCMPKDHVHCGSRYNPYGPSQPTDDDFSAIVESKDLETVTTSVPVGTEMLTDELQTKQSDDVLTSLGPNEEESASSIVPTDLTNEEIKRGGKFQNTDEFVQVSTQLPGSSSEMAVEKSKDANDTSPDSVTDEKRSGETSGTTQKTGDVTRESVTKSATELVSDAPAIKTTVHEENTGSTVQTSQNPVECPPGSPDCVVDKDGSVLRCPAGGGIHPHPRDERKFLVCDRSMILVKACPGSLIFNSANKRCELSFIVRSFPSTTTNEPNASP